MCVCVCVCVCMCACVCACCAVLSSFIYMYIPLSLLQTHSPHRHGQHLRLVGWQWGLPSLARELGQPSQGTGRDDVPHISGGVVGIGGDGHSADVAQDGVCVVGRGEDETTALHVCLDCWPGADFGRRLT